MNKQGYKVTMSHIGRHCNAAKSSKSSYWKIETYRKYWGCKLKLSKWRKRIKVIHCIFFLISHERQYCGHNSNVSTKGFQICGCYFLVLNMITAAYRACVGEWIWNGSVTKYQRIHNRCVFTAYGGQQLFYKRQATIACKHESQKRLKL